MRAAGSYTRDKNSSVDLAEFLNVAGPLLGLKSFDIIAVSKRYFLSVGIKHFELHYDSINKRYKCYNLKTNQYENN